MTTGLQLALLAGALVGLGVALLAWRLVPAQPDLAESLARLGPHPLRRPTPASSAGPADTRERLGLWATRTLPTRTWSRVPQRHLAILRISEARFYGEKVTFALVGLLAPPLLGSLFAIIGLPVPIAAPVIASVGLAAVLFFIPDYNVRDDAKKARAEFTRALGAYVDLVALERITGSGSRQSMETAATVGDSWVFTRLSEELARSRWSGEAPWAALSALSEELGLPDLDDLADIMRLTGEEGAQVYGTLRARSAGMRAAMLSDELARANEVGERMTIPMSLLGVIFMAILITPALLRLLDAS